MKWIVFLVCCVALCGGVVGVAEEEIQKDEKDRMIAEAGALIYASRDARMKHGDLELAETKLRSALKIIEKAMGPNHSHVAVTLNDLAVLKKEMGRYDEAEKLFARALAIKKKIYGADHPEVVGTVMNLGALYYQQGQFDEAEPLFEQAVSAFKRSLGERHPSTAIALNNLGTCYRDMGRKADAESCFKESLEIHKQAMGLDDPRTAQMMGTLGTFYRVNRQFDRAAELLEQSLGILTSQPEPMRPLIARQQGELGVVHLARKEFVQAEQLLKKCLDTLQETVGDQHESVSSAKSNLASLYKVTGRFEEARTLFESSLAISEQVNGVSHPFSSRTRINLASTLIDLKMPEEALELARKEARASRGMLEQMLSFTTESERLEFRSSKLSLHILASLNASTDVAEEVLRDKGIILESLLEDRKAVDLARGAGLSQQWNDLREKRAQLRSAVLRSPDPESIRKLESRVRELEKKLSRDVSTLGTTRKSLSLTVEQVQKTLSPKTAVIDFFQYSRYDGRGEWTLTYGMVAWRSDAAPHFVSCESSEVINHAISAFRKAMDVYDDEGLAEASKDLYRLLIEPMRNDLEGAETLVICPDGPLGFISFAALQDPDGKFLAENFHVGHVAGVRDLLKEVDGPFQGPAVLVGNPEFLRSGKIGPETPGSEMWATTLRSGLADDLGSINLVALPGTREEIHKVSGILGKLMGQSEILTGGEASEAAVRNVQSPRILHLATHGFFFDEIKIETPQMTSQLSDSTGGLRRQVHNPMYRSGIALAGAQNTIDLWRQGNAPKPANDGILMAVEVADLDLSGTELVTLSACNTATGELLSGEGVLGLRRGFVMAGARNLLMTLWPVADEDTADFMDDFYTRYVETGNAPRSLSEVQGEWLVRLRDEKSLVHAVNRAGAFIMSSQGRFD